MFDDARAVQMSPAQKRRYFEEIWAARDEIGASVKGLVLVEAAAKELNILAEHWVWLMCLLGESLSRDAEAPLSAIDIGDVEPAGQAVLPP